jgi:hypothetical protein
MNKIILYILGMKILIWKILDGAPRGLTEILKSKIFPKK